MFKSGVYAITPSGWPIDSLLTAIEEVLKAGVSVIQYRDKGRNSKETLHIAQEIVVLSRKCGVPCIINDKVELARKVGADGVHIGREDGGVRAARIYLGEKAIIGASCYGEQDRAVTVLGEGADYVAFGSVFASSTKPQALSIGIDHFAQLCQNVAGPCVAIGGITPQNVKQVYLSGAYAVAVISSIFEFTDKNEAIKVLQK